MLKFEKLPFSIDDTFIGADLHLAHLNICRGTTDWSSDRECRDFTSPHEMNELIINNINEKVHKDALIIHIGDFSFQGKDNVKKLRERINCKNIIAIRGNHDQHILGHKDLFLDVLDIAHYRVESLLFVACHFPVLHHHEMNNGSMMFHGHLHGHGCEELKSYQAKYKIQDVGIDVYKKLKGTYNLFSLKELNTLLSNKNKTERHGSNIDV